MKGDCWEMLAAGFGAEAAHRSQWTSGLAGVRASHQGPRARQRLAQTPEPFRGKGRGAGDHDGATAFGGTDPRVLGESRSKS